MNKDDLVIIKKDNNNGFKYMPEYILGYLKDTEELVKSEIGHTIVIGKAGTMKTTAYTIPNILHSIDLGQSMVITDMDGEIFFNTKVKLKENGYEIKILNMEEEIEKEKEITLNISDQIIDDEDIVKFIYKVVNNFSSTNDSYIKDEMKIILASLILFINKFKEKEYRTIAKINEELNKGVENLKQIFNELVENNQIEENENAFLQELLNNAAITNIIYNLIDTLKAFEVYSLNKTDFSELGKKKCAYFIGRNKSKYKFDSTKVYITQSIKELVEYADTIKEKNLPLKVKFFLDDFELFNGIDELDKIMATVRSRNIDINIILQSVESLKAKYGETQSEGILANCFIKIFFSNDSPYTDETFDYIKENNKEIIKETTTGFINNNMAIVLVYGEEPVIANKIKNIEFKK